MYEDIYNVIDKSKVKFGEPLSKHTTFKIGGNADILVLPENVQELVDCIKYARSKNIHITLIGNGSKLLVKDGGLRGMVIKLASRFATVEIDGEYVTAMAGATLPYLSGIAKKNGLTGLEFACGIPGTLGGGIFQNAGAYSGEMSNIVEEVTYLDENLELKIRKKDELDFGYRTSFFKKNPKNIIVSAKLKLNYGNAIEIEEKCKENTEKRKEKQPLEYPSAGSVFKRPEGYFVGKLIDDLGLKGYTIGKAQISTKHSGFIINLGGAKASDVIQIIQHVKTMVYEKVGVKLEEEIIIIGDEE